MVEGKYSIELKTPRGCENGILLIIQQGTNIYGSITYMGSTYKFSGGKVDNYNFKFSGEFKWLFMRIPYDVEGKVIKDKLTGRVKTKYGEFEVKGNKI